MATRNDDTDQNKAADEAARTSWTVTDEAIRVGEQTARAGADITPGDTEMVRDTFQRVTDQFNQALSFNSPPAEELARRASQDLQAVSQASTVLARGAQEVVKS